MFESLRPATSAYFFRRTRRLTAGALRSLLSDVHASSSNASRALFRVVRERVGGSLCSGICFAYDRPVPFLEGEQRDRVRGYLLFIEYGDFVVLLRSGLDLTPAFRRDRLEAVERRAVERAVARSDAVFERLSLRNMTVSPLALRSKTLEGRDVENSVAILSAGRSVPQNYRVRRPDGSYSATPSTARIGKRGGRLEIDPLVAWAEMVADLLADEASPTSSFILGFARPQDFARLASSLSPTFFSVDAMTLADRLLSEVPDIRLVRQGADGWRQLPTEETEAILEALQAPFETVVDGDGYALLDEGGLRVGRLRFRAKRIALDALDSEVVDDVFVENAAVDVGDDPERRTLARYVDGEDLVVVLFDDPALAYIDGSLFRDDALSGGGGAFLRFLAADPALAATTSEKGTFAAGQTAFTGGSVFAAVVAGIATEDVLICDDLGDEWADFIGVSTTAEPQRISFYHAKHGSRSLSASAFHDAIGQGIKNLGRMSMTGPVMEGKFVGWADRYRADGVQTAIDRLIRGGPMSVARHGIEHVASGPGTIRRVVLVTSSLSRTDVEDQFATLAAGGAVRPNFVQLYWLLKGFFSACAEVGVYGSVICRP